MSGFTIGEPVQEVSGGGRGRYAEFWDAAQLLKVGMFLLVVCAEKQLARNFANGSRGTARARGCRIIVRGTTVYLLREPIA